MVCRKFIFVALLLSFFACPLPVLSTETRGIKPTSSDLQDSRYLGNYHALIIGIDNYKEWNPLETAVKDAQALKEVLIQRYGFKKEKVVLRTDNKATRLRLIRDLRNLASNLGNQDNLLIYYAGHGQLDDLTGDGYWIPVEGKLKDPGTWISHSTIKNILSSQRVKGKNIVVVADSCYSGTLLRGGPSLLSFTQEGYHHKLLESAARRSRQVITSGGLEPVADGGRDGHSLFAYYFLKALKENRRQIIDLENLFHAYVWKPVTEIGDQRPNVGRLKTPMDEDGQFVLLTTDTKGQPASAENVDTQLEAEKKRLAAEAARIERERRELEQLREKFETQQLLAEQEKRLEAESQRLEEEKLKLASIPKSVTAPRVSLRKKPLMIPHQMGITRMLAKYNFFDRSKNAFGSFKNNLIENNDGTVTDEATGLMWQKGGSLELLDNRSGKQYVKQLNSKHFAGYSDWRMPTIEELASLLARSRNKGAHIAPEFESHQTSCWSADKSEPINIAYLGAWIVDFKNGTILEAWHEKPTTNYPGWDYTKNTRNHVKAVRSVK
jgi:uncharacterized caspase-like protein